MKDPVTANIDLMDLITDRALEDVIGETGQITAIDIYPAGDDEFELITKNAEIAGTELFRNMFKPQRDEIRQLVQDTYKDHHTALMGNGDISFTADDISEDDIDELLMLSLDPKHATLAQPEAPEKPATPIETAEGGTNG